MSILGNYAITILLSAGALAIPAFVALITGAFRPPAEPRPIPARQTAWYLAMVLGLGLFCFLAVQVFYVAVKQALAGGATPSPSTQENFSPKDWAFLSTAPQIGAFLVLLIGDYAVGGSVLLRQIGIALSRFPRGVLNGLAGIIIILPPVYLGLAILAWVYDRLGYSHPQEHELLLKMREAHVWVRIVLIFAAVIVAPVSEEYLFRGHVQTLLRRLMMRRSKPPPDPSPPPEVPAQPVAALPATALSYVALPSSDSAQIGWRAWTAILLTSLLFAAVHPMWMWPAIFVLALGLGYAYERSGSLWTPIIVHCAFNSISTGFYLLVAH